MLQMVITDLDGTLADPDQKISAADLNTLKRLGENNIIRVIATGRSLYSVNNVLDKKLPIDYLLFSSGAGILNWKTKKIIKKNSLTVKNIQTINTYLKDIQADFMLHFPIPEDHKFLYYESGKDNPDFKRRIEIYKSFSDCMHSAAITPQSACHYIIITSNNHITYKPIANELKAFSVIRTTSPLDKKTLWIEIFPAHVSKGQSAAWLCDQLGVDQKNVLSIGNDYNDLDLLEWSGYSFVVHNAQQLLKKKFNHTKSNHESAFTHAVHQVIYS
ncbi:MAG: HAD family phosphatase [Calditrichaceae bacterium]|nr:HAD family phosphatase [Calditrichaceae bacterium]